MQKIDFALLREKVPPKEAAIMKGLPVKRGDMVCCPFHDEKTPSMKLYADHFHCFGCGKHGDSVTLTARLLGLSAVDAAKRLGSDFHVPGFLYEGEPTKVQIPYTQTEEFKRDNNECFKALRRYRDLLVRWKQQFAPSYDNFYDLGMDDDEIEPDPRFTEACKYLDEVEDMLTTLSQRSDAERVAVIERVKPKLTDINWRVNCCG